MTQELTLIETVPLENGLELCLYDGSRKIAGDRWFLSLTATVVVPLAEAPVGETDAAADLTPMAFALGPTVVFEKKLHRHFVAQAEKESVFRGMRDSFVGGAAKYLSHPDFPKKLIQKRYREYQEKAQWYRS